jgi:hypothetical protein
MKKKVVFVLFALVAMALISCVAIEREKRAAQIVEMSADDVKACQVLGNIDADIVAMSISQGSRDDSIALAKQQAKKLALDMGATNVVFDKLGKDGSKLTGKAYKCVSK